MFPEQKSKSPASVLPKLFLAAVILICFSTVLGVAGYLAGNKPILNSELQISITPEASPTPIVKDETADWKTYRNMEYEIKYPTNFLTQEINAGVQLFSESLKGNINIESEEKPIEECIINSESVGENQGLLISRDQKIVDYVIFYHYKNYPEFIGAYCGMSSGCQYKDIYRAFRNNICYGLTYERSDREFMEGNPYNNPKITGEVSEVPKILDQILSTFKFNENDSAFFCGTSTVFDIDNNIYNTVQIGSQCWLKENLRVTKNSEGKPIIRYCYNNDPKICETDGGLYDWNTAMNNSAVEGSQGICPNGWHIPKDSEWFVLENGLKDASKICDAKREGLWDCDSAGKKLKQGGISGFEGIFAGTRKFDTSGANDLDNLFLNRGKNAHFWSSTEIDNASAWPRYLSLDYSTVLRRPNFKTIGFSVRCLKDEQRQ